MKEVASFENIWKEEGVFLDMYMTEEELEEELVQPKKQWSPQKRVMATNYITFQSVEEKLQQLQDFIHEVSARLLTR